MTLQHLFHRFFNLFLMKGFQIVMIAMVVFFLYPAPGWSTEIGYDYNYGPGKFDIRSQSPAQSLRLTLPMLVPGDMRSGWGTHVNCTWSNVWASGPEYLLDYEMFDTIAGISYGFNKKFALSVEFENRHYFGGCMDNPIQQFHNLFGIDQNGRSKVPHNRKVIQRFNPQTGQLLSETSADELDNNSIDFLLNYNVTTGTRIWPSVNIYGVVRYGLDCPDICETDNPLDFGIGLGFAKRWSKRWHSYLSIGYTFYELRKTTAALGVKPIEFENKALNGLLAASWDYTPDFAIVTQYLYSGPDIKNLQGMDKPSHEVQIGFKWKTKYGLMEFALTENIINMGNSPDFGLHTGWSYTF